jgi:hypothetical protein
MGIPAWSAVLNSRPRLVERQLPKTSTHYISNIKTAMALPGTDQSSYVVPGRPKK